jgi:hypothetical protein
MVEDTIHILPTRDTPEYLLYPEGIIKIKGRGLFGSNYVLNKEITTWIEEYIKNPAEITYVIIAFEYLNSFSTLILVNILKDLSKVALQSGKLDIKWYYEEGDEDLLERGEYISSMISIPIKFSLISNIAEL